MAGNKQIPGFDSEDHERGFWATHDSTVYVDWRTAKRVALANLKPSTKAISIRLPESLLEELKLLANKRDVPYQSLVKLFLAERIVQESHSKYSTAVRANMAPGKLAQGSFTHDDD